MIRIAIAEDDKGFQQTIQSYIARYGEENQLPFHVTTFDNGSQLVFQYEPVYDILLLDIEMPKLNGMDAAREIRRQDKDVVIIFITNMAQYAINGYEVGALDYVLKPIRYYGFAMKLGKAVAAARQEEKSYILIPYEDGKKRLASDQIVYVEIQDHWLHIHTDSGVYQMLGTMREFATRVKGLPFVLCSASYLINLKYVTAYVRDVVILDGKYEVKVSRSRKKELQQAILDYYKEGMR